IEAIMARLRTKAAYASDLEHKTATQQAPRADTMRLLLGALETRYGGVHRWLSEQGWTSADTDRLRRKLLSD
ncbi:MAG: tyrosine-protein phosphatase, partial [Terracoccus sp.]